MELEDVEKEWHLEKHSADTDLTCIYCKKEILEG